MADRQLGFYDPLVIKIGHFSQSAKLALTLHNQRPNKSKGTITKNKHNKLAPCGTDGRLFMTDVSAKFKVT